MTHLPATPTVPNRIRRFERLLEVSRSLSKCMELEPFLQGMVDAACELTYSEASSISLYEEATGLLKFVAAPKSQWDTLKRLHLPLENSVAGQCYMESQPVIILEGSQDGRIYREIDKLLEFQTHSLLAVPMIYRDQTIGVLEAVNKRARAVYTEEDITILETLASQAAIAIQYTHLLEKAQQAYNELAELHRMKSDFVAIASHELRTPLGLIIGHATMLGESIQNAELKKQTEVILQSSLRLKKIVEDLDNVDKVHGNKAGVKLRTVALDQLIQEVVGSFQEAAQHKKIRLITDLPKSGLIVVGDAEKIAIALSNLVRNAITFTNQDGHVKVSAESLLGYARVSIIDDGIGIPSKDLPRVFERFFQVEGHLTRRHNGMGLGLSVAKVMIELHGGQIWAESVEGRGSNFSFLLPTGLEQPVLGRSTGEGG